MKTGTRYITGAALCAILLAACQSPAGSSGTTLIYYGNGGVTLDGAASVADPAAYADGSEATLAANTFSLADATFLRWNTAADGSGASYSSGDKVTLAGNLALYAIWKAKTALEILDGLNNVVKLRYDLRSDGSQRSLKEWSTSWDAQGLQSTDYYCEYGYGDTVDKVLIYSDETKVSSLGTYEYEKDASGNVIQATWFDASGAKVKWWKATYNAQGKYLTYIYFYDDAGSAKVSDNRACVYAPDGIHYLAETYYDGEGTETADFQQSYEAYYANDDASSGIMAKEVHTKLIPPASEEGAAEYFVTTYLFSWVGNDYIQQMAHIDDAGNVMEAYNYTYAAQGSTWLRTSLLYLVDNVATTYETFGYDGSRISRHFYYDMLNGKQMAGKVLYSYDTDAEGNYLMTTKTYAYAVSRGPGAGKSDPPAFWTLPSASGH